MRKALAVALACAIQAAGLSAPLLHAHPDEHASGHHDGRTVHSHWADHDHPSHSSGTPAFQSTDADRAVFLNAFVAVAASSISSPGVPPAVFELLVSSERAAHQVIEIAPGHDPPGAASLPSRAPPAFLS